MSAGTGVRHSEFNPSRTSPVHFLQIWIEPEHSGIAPSYEQRRFEPAEKRGRLRLIASPDAREGSVKLHQNAYIYSGLFDGAEGALLRIEPDRRAYVHVARGSVTVNGTRLEAGDAAKLTGVAEVAVESGQNAEILLFDLT